MPGQTRSTGVPARARADARERTARRRQPPHVELALALQRTAGNRAVGGLLQRSAYWHEAEERLESALPKGEAPSYPYWERDGDSVNQQMYESEGDARSAAKQALNLSGDETGKAFGKRLAADAGSTGLYTFYPYSDGKGGGYTKVLVNHDSDPNAQLKWNRSARQPARTIGTVNHFHAGIFDGQVFTKATPLATLEAAVYKQLASAADHYYARPQR